MTQAWAYFDASAFVRLYIRDKGSTAARRMATNNRLLSSALLPSEVFSKLTRKKSEGCLSDDDYSGLIENIREGITHVELVRMTDDLLKRADEIALQSAAGAPNAIHIASALIFREAVDIELPFVTSDAEQEEAADRYGLKTVFIG